MIGLRKPLAGAGLLLALSLAVWASPAAAQRPDDMKGGGQNPCAADAQKLCNEFIPDRAKVASCLFKNKRQLAPACRAELGGGTPEAFAAFMRAESARWLTVVKQAGVKPE